MPVRCLGRQGGPLEWSGPPRCVIPEIRSNNRNGQCKRIMLHGFTCRMAEYETRETRSIFLL